MRRATTTQSPGVDLLALLGNRDRKSATDALFQPLVLREQLEQRLHRPPSGWSAAAIPRCVMAPPPGRGDTSSLMKPCTVYSVMYPRRSR